MAIDFKEEFLTVKHEYPDPAGVLDDNVLPQKTIVPEKLTNADLKAAQQVILFIDLRDSISRTKGTHYWNDIPPVSENYAKARTVIFIRVMALLDSLQNH